MKDSQLSLLLAFGNTALGAILNAWALSLHNDTTAIFTMAKEFQTQGKKIATVANKLIEAEEQDN